MDFSQARSIVSNLSKNDSRLTSKTYNEVDSALHKFSPAYPKTQEERKNLERQKQREDEGLGFFEMFGEKIITDSGLPWASKVLPAVKICIICNEYFNFDKLYGFLHKPIPEPLQPYQPGKLQNGRGYFHRGYTFCYGCSIKHTVRELREAIGKELKAIETLTTILRDKEQSELLRIRQSQINFLKSFSSDFNSSELEFLKASG